MPFELAVDIGGTFTDVVLRDGATSVTQKVLTTYDDPANGVLEGIDEVLRRADASPEACRVMLHGTTLATNALIERRGAVTALLTTDGHRDAVEMALENRFEQYDLNIDRPRPLVPRPLRLPVCERLDARGEVLIPLDEESVRRWIPAMEQAGVTSVAIGLLHAYANPAHEERVAEILLKAMPDVSISLSSSVCPEIREYERLSTTCANAYVKPLMGRYLTSLAAKFRERGFRCPVLLMTSGGGLTTLAAAVEFPIRLVESGPAGGAILAAEVAMAGGHQRALSFDMGGTTAKLCVIDDGQPLLSRAFEVDRSYRFKKGSGLPVRIPVIEMVEIGAGGGSLAAVDALGRVQVGPESAGSEPGPACYGRGGERPAVTDGDLVLGRIDPEAFAGGRLTLDVAAASRALEDHVGQPSGTNALQAAHAVSEVVSENMAAAARAHLSEWGRGVEGRVLIAFGGAAPLHACLLAHKLKIDRVVVPANAGVGSAVGFLLAPVGYEVVRSHYMRLADLDVVVIERLMEEMEAEALGVIGEIADASRLSARRRAFMRYLGQGFEIAVELEDASANLSSETLRDRFEENYRALYGRTIPDLDVEILSWTLNLAEQRDGPSLPRESLGRDHEAKTGEARELFDPLVGRTVTATCLQRDALAPGDYVAGPALITETQTTIVVGSEYGARVSSGGAIVIDREPAGGGK
jgi:N-methylhydantoinase A